MAPSYPEEVDVFTVPHSRMKELVHTYLERVSYTNFRDVGYMTGVLEKLCHTFHVFKAHEQIENRFIMRRLKEKLTALDITDAAVCNCHSDNRLTEMMSLVLDGYRWAQRGEGDRVKYGLRLWHALEDFMQVFIPHMKEEEEVFQPMLVEYFTYDELKELKVKVIQQHMQREEEASGKETSVPESECDTNKEEEEEEGVEASPLEQLPTELTMKIFTNLSPQDLCRCAQVSHHLNRMAMDPSLWRTILPVHWAAGDWTWNFNPSTMQEEERTGSVHGSEDEEEDYSYLHDEDADKDESSDSDSSESPEDDTLHMALHEVRVVSGVVRHLLGRVGSGVERINLAHSSGISSSLLHRVLKLCPNLKVLTLAHTRITDAAFREYGLKGGCCMLEHLDLSGCHNITDSTLHSLAGSTCTVEDSAPNQPPATPWLSCCGMGCCSAPSTKLVQVSVYNPDPAILDSDHVIVANKPYTDVPQELCDALNCMDFGGIQVPAGKNSFPVRSVPAGGTLLARGGQALVGGSFVSAQTLVRSSALSTDSVVSCCSGVRTCCGSETGRAESNRDCISVEQLGGGCSDTIGQTGRQERGDGKEEPHALHRLTHLSLNSCYRITNNGLRAMWERGGLPQLQYLDLSGCLNLTGEGVASLVDTCSSLDHAFLFYCDNIYPDPFPATASGCRNLECNTAFCCRSGD